jgi:alpha-mannosidase
MGGGIAPQESSHYPKLNFTPKGQQIRHLYQDRIKNFTATGQYESVNLRSMWNKDSEDDSEYVTLEVYSVPDLARPPFEEAMKGSIAPDTIQLHICSPIEQEPTNHSPKENNSALRGRLTGSVLP